VMYTMMVGITILAVSLVKYLVLLAF
jgi:hypothetical protein